MDDRAGTLVRQPAVDPVTQLHRGDAARHGGANAIFGRNRERRAQAARGADYILTPDWLRAKAAVEFGLHSERVLAFPMEGRMANEWEATLDYGQVKMGIGLGPLDRLLLFIGPLEHAAGVDLLLESLPVQLQRAGNVRTGLRRGGQPLRPAAPSRPPTGCRRLCAHPGARGRLAGNEADAVG